MSDYLKNHESDTFAPINFREQIEKYLGYWKWFVVSVLLMFTLAFMYLRYTIPQYKAATTILVKDDRKGGMASELSAFSDIGMLKGIKSNVDNEVEVVKSRSLIQKTVSDLELNVIYINEGNIRDGELYNGSPIKLIHAKKNKDDKDVFHQYLVSTKTQNSFEFSSDNIVVGVFNYGSKIEYKNSEIIVLKNGEFHDNKNFKIKVQVHPVENIANSFKGRLSVLTLGKNTSVIELNIVDPLAIRAKDFLNKLVENYNKDAVEDKNFIAENTAKFIENRLKLIYSELDTVEKDAESFKKTNRVTDIASEAGLFLENASDFEKKEIETETQLKVVNTMIDYLKESTVNDLIPANVLSGDPSSSELIKLYNTLVLERNRLLKTAGENNSTVVAITKKIPRNSIHS